MLRIVKVRQIGRGNFSQVWLHIGAHDGKYVAAKIAPSNAHNRKRPRDVPAWLSMIRHEYALMKENAHPNVMPVYELYEREKVMIVMRYFPLGDMGRAGISDQSQLGTAFGQLLDCISFLHSRNIVHRDIKPQNVLVEERLYFKVVLTDFGLSKAVSEHSELTTFCGTLDYIAPKVSGLQASAYGPPADVWSLGVMGLEWLRGLPLKSGRSQEQ